MRKKEKMQVIKEYLCDTYGDTPCTLDFENAFELLVSACLAAQCTDARVNMVTPALFAKYPTVQSFAEADIADVEELIRSTGFFRNKAKNIVACAQALMERFDGKVPDNMEDLLSLPGVGRKIANLLLGDIYGKPAVVADTHCIRICGRLGMYPESEKDPVRIERILKEIIPPQEGSDFCHRIVIFGREICSARSPSCNSCPLSDLCESAKRGRTNE